jgi:hypothetical protein
MNIQFVSNYVSTTTTATTTTTVKTISSLTTNNPSNSGTCGVPAIKPSTLGLKIIGGQPAIPNSWP